MFTRMTSAITVAAATLAIIATLAGCGGPPGVEGSVTTPTPLGMGQPCRTALLTCAYNWDLGVVGAPGTIVLPFPYPRVYCGCPVGSFATRGPTPSMWRVTPTDADAACGTASPRASDVPHDSPASAAPDCPSDYWVLALAPAAVGEASALSPAATQVAWGLMVARAPAGPRAPGAPAPDLSDSTLNWTSVRRTTDVGAALRQLYPAADVAAGMRAAGLRP